MAQTPDIRHHLPRGWQHQMAKRRKVGRSYISKALADRRPHVAPEIKAEAADVARLAGRRRSLSFWFPTTPTPESR